MSKLEKIYEIALQVRETCVQLAHSKLSEDMDFYQSGNLACMCACASWILRNELRRNGISASVTWGEFVDDNGSMCGGHVWVKCKDWYIDLTAQQFSWFFNDDPEFDDVMMFHRKKDTGTSQYYTNPVYIRSLLAFNDWPDSQNPAAFVLKPEVRKFIREKMAA